MHYHVALRSGPGQISVLTGHHTYRTETAALDAAGYLVENDMYSRLVRSKSIRTKERYVYVMACERSSCLGDER